MKYSRSFIAALLIILSIGSLSQIADAKRKDSKVPVRISYSGNMVGELEPCG
jgi:hypothetical protein